MPEAIGADSLSAEERERIIEKDKAQYLQWLHGGGAREKQSGL
jgi:hypothetical protein